jgi:hypothetical protein
MAKVYKDKEEFMRKLKYVPVIGKDDPHIAVYSEGKKIGRFDKNNLVLKKTVKMKIENDPLDYTREGRDLSNIGSLWHRFFCTGDDNRPVKVDFAEVDKGFEPRKFSQKNLRQYLDLIDSMYRKNGTLDVNMKLARDLG